MPRDLYDCPLTMDEIVQLDELLAQIDENNVAMDASETDGFLTALQLLPNEVAPSEWMPLIFSSQKNAQTSLSHKDQDTLENLIYRRYREIERQLNACKPLDPIVFDPEDEDGNELCGEESIVALQNFASGFLTAAQTWPGLLDTGDEALESALMGVWRHLPPEQLGDFETIQKDLLSEAPLEDLDDAIADLAICVGEVAQITRGFQKKQKSTQKKH